MKSMIKTDCSVKSYHCFQQNTKLFLTCYCEGLTSFIDELLGIISVDFDINQALVIYSGFIKYCRKLGIDSVSASYRKVLIGAIPLCYTIFIKCNVYGSVHLKNIPIYCISNKSKVTQFNISVNCCIFFGWCLHPSSGVHTAVSTASGICHTVTTTCCYRGRVSISFSCLFSGI
jgi:hypothetical protein